jgi:hypothetical protein
MLFLQGCTKEGMSSGRTCFSIRSNDCCGGEVCGSEGWCGVVWCGVGCSGEGCSGEGCGGGEWSVECGVWRVEGGVWSVVVCVWSVLCIRSMTGGSRRLRVYLSIVYRIGAEPIPHELRIVHPRAAAHIRILSQHVGVVGAHVPQVDLMVLYERHGVFCVDELAGRFVAEALVFEPGASEWSGVERGGVEMVGEEWSGVD